MCSEKDASSEYNHFLALLYKSESFPRLCKHVPVERRTVKLSILILSTL